MSKIEEIDYSVLFRWFVGLGMDDPIWSPTTFSNNRERLLQSDIAAKREAALLLLALAAHAGTVGGDKGLDVPSVVAGVRAVGVTPHVAQKVTGSAIDGQDHPPCRLHRQPTETETDRAGHRLDENGRGLAQAAAPRRPLGRLDP